MLFCLCLSWHKHLPTFVLVSVDAIILDCATFVHIELYK